MTAAGSSHDYTHSPSPWPIRASICARTFLPDYGLTPGTLARAMGLKDRTRIERLVREQQPVTSDTALRLARVFGTTAEFWMNLQTQHDLSKAAIAAREELARIVPFRWAQGAGALGGRSTKHFGALFARRLACACTTSCKHRRASI